MLESLTTPKRLNNMGWRQNRYNKRSAKQMGWHPSWFAPHLLECNDELTIYVKAFQTKHELTPDGLVGPTTFRRILAQRELDQEKPQNHILVNGELRSIDWDVKIDLIKPGAFKKISSNREPSMLVTHWDVCTSAEKCKRVLEAKNISTHFCIDNDGVIHQFLDTNDVGWHAGIRTVNNKSIGIDFSNAYYTKYNKIYEQKGFGKRPILSDSKVHGIKLKPHLGYYNIQIEAYKKLIQFLCKEYDIPLEVPRNKDNGLLTKVNYEASKGRFNGVVCHYHLTKRKIDCAGLELAKIVDSLG